VYARPVLRPARAVVILLTIAVAATACRRETAQERAAALCHDLLALRATVAFLAAPGTGASVGDVRGGLDKLDATFAHVPENVGRNLLDARDAYREMLNGVGDDDRFASIAAGDVGVPGAFGTAYGDVLTRLACGASLDAGG
jgi:hypothetical protein